MWCDACEVCVHALLTAFCIPADFAISRIFWKEFGIMATDPGYGYFRPSINLFDPGWRLTPDQHDTGTHAAGVMDRSVLRSWCLWTTS